MSGKRDLGISLPASLMSSQCDRQTDEEISAHGRERPGGGQGEGPRSGILQDESGYWVDKVSSLTGRELQAAGPWGGACAGEEDGIPLAMCGHVDALLRTFSHFQAACLSFGSVVTVTLIWGCPSQRWSKQGTLSLSHYPLVQATSMGRPSSEAPSGLPGSPGMGCGGRRVGTQWSS